MKSALMWILMGANAVAFLLITNPTRRDLHESRRGTVGLERTIGQRGNEVALWDRLRRLIRGSQSRIESLPTDSEVQLSVLQDVLLDAEQGLSLRRASMDIRLESDVPVGFRGYRIDMETRGDFSNVYQYLYRVSRLGVPLRMERLELAPDPVASSLRLDATWTTTWPE